MLLGLLGVGHEEALTTKPGCVTPRFLPSVSLFPGGELAFVARSPSVIFPWLRAIRNSLHLLWPTNSSWKVWTSLSLTEQLPTDGANDEASRHRDPRGRQMDAPFQLKMILASINLQKTSEQVVRTHSLMVLLAFYMVINLPFLLSEKAYLLSSHGGPFYSVRSSIPFNGGKTFWLVMMALR